MKVEPGYLDKRTKTQGLKKKSICQSYVSVRQRTGSHQALTGQLFLIFKQINLQINSYTCLLRWPHPHRRRLWCGRWCCLARWTCLQSGTRMPRCQDDTVWKPGCCPACHLCSRSYNNLVWCLQPGRQNHGYQINRCLPLDWYHFLLMHTNPSWKTPFVNSSCATLSLCHMHTVAGPMIVMPFSSAILIIFLVWASGMPSAMMAIVWI